MLKVEQLRAAGGGVSSSTASPSPSSPGDGHALMQIAGDSAARGAVSPHRSAARACLGVAMMPPDMIPWLGTSGDAWLSSTLAPPDANDTGVTSDGAGPIAVTDGGDAPCLQVPLS